MEGSRKKLETHENSWIFNQGKWRKVWKNVGTSKKFEEKYSLMAIELTLKN